MRAFSKSGVVAIAAVLGLSGGILAIGTTGATASPGVGGGSHHAGANNTGNNGVAHSNAVPSNRAATSHAETGSWSILQQPNSNAHNLSGGACVAGTTTCWVTGGI